MENERKKEVLKIVGKECKQWRQSEGLTLSDVANQLDVSISTIWNFEQGMNDSLYIGMWYGNNMGVLL